MQMVSLQDSHCHSNSNQFPLIRTGQCGQSSCSSTKICRNVGRSMRTIRSNFYRTETDNSFCSYTTANDDVSNVSENVTDSAIDMRLGELVNVTVKSVKSSSSDDEFLEISQAFSDFSSDISGELQRLACVPNNETKNDDGLIEQENEPCLGFLERESFSAKIIDSISPEDLVPTVKICIDGLQSPSIAVRRSAASKLRLLAKNRADNRALIGESGAIPVLIPLLRCNDPWTQEHAVTALLNLSLHEENKSLIANEGAIKSLVYVLKTGTETSKQNAACALLNLALIEENKSSIGACGAIPPLVSLLISGSNRGKKDALTSLYKLCSIRQNKERAVSAGAVKPLVEMVGENAVGTAEKAMVILSSLAAIDEGKEAIVQEGGIVALVEAIEDSSVKGKEFAVLTLLQLCCENVRNRGLLVREGAIPPLVALSQTGSARTKHKAERLLGYLREPRQEGSSPSPRSEVV